MYHSKRIGIFISHLFGSFQKALCQGIIDKASEFGYHTDIFSSMDGENIGQFTNGENSILKIPNFQELSGIVFASNTYLTKQLQQDILHTLQENCVCPVIEVNQQDAAYPVVMLDNNTTAGELTNHLITCHKLTHICYLGNSLEMEFSIKRQKAYETAMQQHGLCVSPQSIYSCSYDRADIEAGLDYFYSAGEKPQAIICYNDRMAMTLMGLLEKRGIRIPEDICITGFDNLEECSHIEPALTTVSFPIYEMGCKTMELLLAAIEGDTLPAVTTVTSEAVYKGSCGCKTVFHSPLSFQQRQTARINRLENSIIHDLNMSSTLNGVNDIDDCIDLLENFVNLLDDCEEIYLCLYPDWDEAPDTILEITDSEKTDYSDKDSILLKFSMKNGKRLHECTFLKKRPLPDYIYENSRNSYIYTPLFFGNHAFGYLAFSFRDNRISYPFSYVSWIMNINHMLQNVCSFKYMGLLTKKLVSVYMHDDLTGHYNRKGFHEKSEALFLHARKTSASVTFFVFDMDHLKHINDTFGHSEGDFAIRILGQALMQAMDENTLCGRVGGDEFYMLAENMTEESSEDLVERVEKYLSNYNKLHTRAYPISVSGGFVFHDFGIKTDSEPTLEELQKAADQNMYLLKKQKKSHQPSQN